MYGYPASVSLNLVAAQVGRSARNNAKQHTPEWLDRNGKDLAEYDIS